MSIECLTLYSCLLVNVQCALHLCARTSSGLHSYCIMSEHSNTLSPVMLSAKHARGFARTCEDSQQAFLNYTFGLPLLSVLPAVARRTESEGALPTYYPERHLPRHDTIGKGSNATPTSPVTEIESPNFAATAHDAEEGVAGPISRDSTSARRTANTSENLLQVLSKPFKWLRESYSTKEKIWMRARPAEGAYNYDFNYANCMFPAALGAF